MPFPNGVSHVARLLEVVWHQGHVDGDARWHEGLDVHVLPPHPVLDTHAVSPRRLNDIPLNSKFDIDFHAFRKIRGVSSVHW